METKRVFYRTAIEVEVLSEGRYDPQTLQQVAHDIVDGECSGQWSVTRSEEVDGPTMARLLVEQGSDPEFFSLDGDGNDLLQDAAEEEDDDEQTADFEDDSGR